MDYNEKGVVENLYEASKIQTEDGIGKAFCRGMLRGALDSVVVVGCCTVALGVVALATGKQIDLVDKE